AEGRNGDAELLAREALGLVMGGAARPAAREVYVLLTALSAEQGDWPRAARYSRDSLRVALEQGRSREVPQSVLSIALFNVLRGRLRTAAARLREAAAMIRDSQEATQYLRQIEANYYRAHGDYRRARRSARRAVKAALLHRDQAALGWATREL